MFESKEIRFLLLEMILDFGTRSNGYIPSSITTVVFHFGSRVISVVLFIGVVVEILDLYCLSRI